MNVSYIEMPTRRQMFDTEHTEIDDAISEATDRLNSYLNAWYDFDRINERYMRLRARVESGRMPRYGNPLGVKVDSSGGGSNGTEDAMINVVMLGNQAGEARRKMMLAQREVKALIRKACQMNGGNARLETALECRYCTTPPVPFGEMPKKYPHYFNSKSGAQWAVIQGEKLVAEYCLDQRRAAVACVG